MDKDKSLKERVLESTDKSCNDSKSGNSGLIKPIVLALIIYLAFAIPVLAHSSQDKSNYNIGMQQKNYSLNQQYEINKHEYKVPQCDSYPGYLK